MKFSYFKIPGNGPTGKWISRPIIPIMLIGPKKSVMVDALIDSGADKCLFHSDIGREIGLDIEKGREEFFGGIEGGKIKTFIHKIQLRIIGTEKEIEIPAGFADVSGVFAILGQEGFFDAYKIKFEKDHNSIEITPVNK
ncbi:retroviral-like aspartic protease family protein [Patescibacteria group bacterium]|nr:retroviral-like aspartic protease family protein [Patescibacteria group bacterium]MBU4162217.1 retroviral-like aspartic protease family protein [Patescibacteria group bacterium]